MIRFAIDHPHAVIVAAMVIAILGLASVARMPVDVFPDLHAPAVMVAITYAGMPAEQMESSITRRLERMFMQADGVDHMESRSLTGLGVVTIYFRPEIDVNAAISQVISLAIADLSRLPPGTLPPLVIRYDVTSLPVCQLTLSSDSLSDTQLYDVANYTIRQQLGGIPGVSAPPVFGGLVRQVMVYLDPQKLQAHGLSPLDVVRAVSSSNLLIPTGTAKIGPREYNVVSNAQLPTPESFNDVPLVTRGGTPIFVRDVGRAVDGSAIVENYVHVDGRRSVYIPIRKQGGANTVRVVDSVRAALPTLTGIPSGVKLDVVFDQSVSIRQAVANLAREGVLGALLAGLAVLVFLGSARSTAAILLAIPLSVLVALAGLWLTNETLNLMTLGGLALALGRVIDDAIVVLENTERKLVRPGVAPREAALEAATEVALPVLASTVTTLIVFLPVLFLTGTGKFLFTPLAKSVVFAMAASYVFAMAFIPMFASRLLHSRQPGVIARALARTALAYRRLLERVVARRRVLYVAVLAAFAAAVGLLPLIGTEFFPKVDSGEFTLTLRAPSGTRVEETEKLVTRLEEAVRKIVPPGELRHIVSNAGVPADPFSAMQSSNVGPQAAFIQVKLARRRSISTDAVIRALRRELPRLCPGTSGIFQTGGIMSAALALGRPAPIDVVVLDEDLDEARTVASRVKDEIERVPGVVDPLVNVSLDYPTLALAVDRVKSAVLGLSEEAVVKNVITSLSSSVFIHPIVWIEPRSGNDYFVGVQYFEDTIESIESLRNVPLQGGVAGKPRATLLRNVAPIVRRSGIDQATHRDVARCIDVFASVDGRDTGSVAREVERRVRAIPLPKGCTIQVLGELEQMRSSFGSFGIALGMATLLVYLVLVAQLESWRLPLIVLAAVPLAAIGVVAILLATGTTFNIQTFLGVMMLIGIVVSNSILIVTFADRARRSGRTALEAAIAAGETRLRPIVMTALATVLGLLPLALGIGHGGEANEPLARAVIGGLMASTFLTLFVVPALYVSLERRGAR